MDVHDDLLRHQHTHWQGRRSGRPRRRRSALPGTGAGRGCRCQDVACLPQYARRGRGPWTNAKGVVIAKDVTDLHGTNNLSKQTALTEKGAVVNGRGDTPNMHDILTGSQPDGTAFPAGDDRTCGNWTKSGAGSAMLGHHDRQGLRDDDASKSWNSSHPTAGPDG